jgi:transporter family-2 protein
MTSRMLAIATAFLAGMGLAVQVGMNGVLRQYAGHPLPAALISFLTGTLALGAYAAATRPPMAAPAEMARGPWWIWVGGLVGAAYVTSAAALAPRLGAAAWLGLIIAGQLIASIVLDHFGLVGFQTHRVNPVRLLGAALLLGGTVLILRS